MADNEYREYYQKYSLKLKKLLQYLKKEQYQTVLWGAGLKGRGFLEICDPERKYIHFVLDRDSNKCGEILPKGHIVKGLEEITDDMVILVANENYYVSICFDLLNRGYDAERMRLVCLDRFISGDFTLGDVRNGKVWERRRYYD